jgi:hypothetical protein
MSDEAVSVLFLLFDVKAEILKQVQDDKEKTNAGLPRTLQVLTKAKREIATDFCEVLAMTPPLSL